MEELNHKFVGAKNFSQLDVKSGYWCVRLDEDSQQLLTFHTPAGWYCFQRLPFGLCVRQDIFQMEMDCILQDCKGAVGIADDISVYGATEEEHYRHLAELMETVRCEGLVFNSNKCSIKNTSITFFGHAYGGKGIRPDRQKVQDLRAISQVYYV